MEIGETVSNMFLWIQEEQKKMQAHPCDVDTLLLEVTGQDYDEKTKSLRLEVKSPKRFDLVTDVKDRDARSLLKSYDILIDCLADPRSAAESKPAEIVASANYVGLKCATQAHALLTLTDLEKETTVSKHLPGAGECKIAPTKFFATKNFFDQFNINREQTFDSVFGLIRGIFTIILNDRHGIKVRAESCGVRAKTDTKRPNYRLVGLVRVIPKLKLAVGLKIPKLGSFKHERKSDTDARGTSSSRETEKSAGFNYYKDKTTSASSGAGVLGTYEHTKEKQVGGEVESYKLSRDVNDGSVTKIFEEKHSKSVGQTMTDKDGTVTQTDIKERLKRASGFDLVIIYNDTKIERKEQIEKIKKMIDDICRVVTGVKDLFNKLPQFGWKFSFDVSVLAGTVNLELSTQYVADVKAGGRYYAVEYKLKGSIEIKVIDLSLSLSFGIDIRALDSGIVAMVEGKLTVEASISKDIDMGFLSPKQEFGIPAKTTAKLSVVGYVSLLGKTLADAELSVSTGMEFADGKLIIDLAASPKFDLKGTLKIKDVELSGYIRVPYWFDSKIDPPVTLVHGCDPLYTFK